MANDDSQSNQPSNRPRRSSFAGETFANLFGSGHRNSLSRTSVDGGTTPAQPTPQYPGAIATAAAQAQRRRLSITTLGLSGSPGQSTAYGSYPTRRDSYSSMNSASIDESAIDDEAGNTQQTPFARRLSMGGRALRDVRGGGNSGGNQGLNGTTNQAPTSGSISARDAKGRGSSEGFNWSDNFRTRAERASSIGQGFQAGAAPPGSYPASSTPSHNRSASIAVMDTPSREMPKAKEQVRPDHFQERILKGDFYMD